MLKIRRPLGRLIFNMGIAIPGKTVFLIETAPWSKSIFVSNINSSPTNRVECCQSFRNELPLTTCTWQNIADVCTLTNGRWLMVESGTYLLQTIPCCIFGAKPCMKQQCLIISWALRNNNKRPRYLNWNTVNLRKAIWNSRLQNTCLLFRISEWQQL